MLKTCSRFPFVTNGNLVAIVDCVMQCQGSLKRGTLISSLFISNNLTSCI